MMWSRQHWTIATMIALIVGLVGCGASMNETEARTHVEGIGAATVRTVIPSASTPGSFRRDLCAPPNTSKVGITYTIDLPPTTIERNRDIAMRIEQYWKRQGYTITGVDFKSDGPGVVGRTSDGVQLDYTSASDGRSRVQVGSPCVTPDTPLP